MNTRTLIAGIYGLTLAAIAVWLLLEHMACAQIHQENTALLQRLSEAIEKLAENQSLQDRTSPANDNLTASTPLAASLTSADPELLRLRSEIAGLFQQHQQMEQLREDTRQTFAALESRRKEDRMARRAANGIVSQLEVIKAEYWTDHTRMDVTEELQDRIRGDKLKAMASNNIKGDPEFGQVKHLTIQYRFGGVTRTNEFREGDVVVLPAE
jgi:hypothetical protein